MRALSCYQKLPQNDFHDTNGDVGILVMNQIRREFHKSLHLSYPMSSRPLLECQHIFDTEIGVRCLMRQRAKCRCLMKMKVEQEEKNKNLDLKLRLSQPGLHPAQDIESSNQVETSSSTSSQRSCMSLDMNSSSSIESFDSTNIIEVPSLVLMGCTRCHIYVMVSEVDPKCPKCNRTVLVDKFCQKPAKKCRKR